MTQHWKPQEVDEHIELWKRKSKSLQLREAKDTSALLEHLLRETQQSSHQMDLAFTSYCRTEHESKFGRQPSDVKCLRARLILDKP